MSMSFSDALVLLKEGKKIAREGWNGAFLVLTIVTCEPLLSVFSEGTLLECGSRIDKKTAGGRTIAWDYSQTEILADDWVEVEIPAEVTVR